MRLYSYILLAIVTVFFLAACAGGGRGTGEAAASDERMSFSQADEGALGARIPAEEMESVSENQRIFADVESEDPVDAGRSGNAEETEEVDATETSVEPTEDEVVSEAETAGDAPEGAAGLAPAAGGVAGNGDDSGIEMIPEGWPYDIPIMEGFTVRYGASDENGLRVGATGEVELDEVKEFYQGLSGWNLATERDRSGVETHNDIGEWRRSIFVITHGDESLTVNVLELDGKTSIDLLYNRIQ